MTTRIHRAAVIGRALASLAVVLVLLVAIPWALATFGGWPITHVPSLSEITTALGAPDDGTLLRSTLIVVGWAAWATYAVSLLVEIPAHLMGVRVPRLPGLSFQQRQVAGLVSAIAALSTLASPAAAMASTHPTTVDSHARTVIAQTVAETSSSENTSSTAAGATSATPVTSPGQPRAGAHMRTVVEGETLWQIAREELGDGARYEQIAQASAAIVQPDGDRLTDPDYIEAGWEVVVPAASQTPARPVTPHEPPTSTSASSGVPREQAPSHAAAPHVSAPQTHTTSPGMVAPPHTAPAAAPSSPAATTPPEAKGVVIPPPSHAVPSSAVSAPSSASPSAPSASAATTAVARPAPSTNAPTDAQTQMPTEKISAAATAADAAVAERAPKSLLSSSRTAYGLGAIAAALLMLLLARRRSMTSRHRLPGRRIKLPTGRAAITETQTRAGADGAAAEYLSRALRALGAYYIARKQPVPALRAARLGATLELYFTSPVELPAPFVAESTSAPIWILEPAGVVDLPPLDELADVPAPWPTLVTVGTDPDGGQILVCLEEVGSLTITGDARTSADTLAAIAAELVASPWADDVTQITLVGTLTELAPHLGSPRVTVADGIDAALILLEASADEHERVLAKYGAVDVATARATEGGWAPHLLLLADEPSESQLHRLQAVLDRMPRVAVAAVATTSVPVGEWVLTVSGDPIPSGTLEPAGLELTPQVLPEEQIADLVEAFALDAPTTQPSGQPADFDAPDTEQARAVDDVDGPAWGAAIPAETPDPSVLPAPAGASLMEVLERDDVDNDILGIDHAPYDLDTPEDIDLDLQARQTVAPALDSGIEDEDDLESDSLTDSAGITPEQAAKQRLAALLDSRPLIRLLAPTPQILNATGPKPESPGMATEALAYLALHPGQSHMAFSEAMWPGQEVRASKRNKLLSYARSWLGTADNGTPYVALVDTDAYQLDPTTPIDVDIFLSLIGDNATTTPLTHLRDALALIDGQPLSGVRAGRYAWAETDRIEICASIVDVAHILAIRSLEAGDPRTAAWAASKGLDADPIAEILWRDAITAAHQAHDYDHITELTQRLTLLLNELDAEPEPATTALIDRLTKVHA